MLCTEVRSTEPPPTYIPHFLAAVVGSPRLGLAAVSTTMRGLFYKQDPVAFPLSAEESPAGKPYRAARAIQVVVVSSPGSCI